MHGEPASMKAIATRVLAAAALAIVCVMALAAASSPARIQEPDKLIILSTVDVKGKTSPCG